MAETPMEHKASPSEGRDEGAPQQAGYCWVPCHPSDSCCPDGLGQMVPQAGGGQRDPGLRARMLSPSPHRPNQLWMIRSGANGSSLN